jgi:chaperonin GroES
MDGLMIPITDRVVMRQIKAAEKTKGGILLAPSEADKPNLAKVLFTGPDCKSVKPGHLVILGTKWFSNFKRGDEELLIVSEPDIIGIADEEDVRLITEKYHYEELCDFVKVQE